MQKTRIEIHVSKEDAEKLTALATARGRSRKNYCEMIVLNYIKNERV